MLRNRFTTQAVNTWFSAYQTLRLDSRHHASLQGSSDHVYTPYLRVNWGRKHRLSVFHARREAMWSRLLKPRFTDHPDLPHLFHSPKLCGKWGSTVVADWPSYLVMFRIGKNSPYHHFSVKPASLCRRYKRESTSTERWLDNCPDIENDM